MHRGGRVRRRLLHFGIGLDRAPIVFFARGKVASRAGDVGEALPRARLVEFAQRQNLPPGSDWALGWDTPAAQGSSAGQHFARSSIGHLGFTGTSLWVDLEAECAVAMLTNRIHLVAKRSKFALRAEIHDLIREAFAE